MTKVIVNEKKEGSNERNFIENPLQIETETVGVLPGERDTKQTAQETPLESSNFTATDVATALDELFQLSDSQRQLLISAIGDPLILSSNYSDIISAILDGKTLLSDAITAKNGTANNTMSFLEFATAILALEGSGGNSSVGGVETALKLTDVITATAGMTYKLGLTTYLKPSETVAQVYKYIEAQNNILHYQENFNNSNASAFIFDLENVYFDGMARIKDDFSYPFLSNGTYLETQEIDMNFVDLNDFILEEESVNFKGIRSNHALVILKSDIPIDELLSISGVGMTKTTVGNGDIQIAVSRDSGASWQTFNGTDFVDVDINDTSDFTAKAMNEETLEIITTEQWELWRQASQKIRFAYLLNRPTYTDNVALDMVTMQAEMIARWFPASTSEYTYTFSESAQEYTFTFLVANDYKIRYLDKEATL